MTVQRSIRELLKGKRSWFVAQGDARELLRRMPEASVHCVVTSPPYWGLRDYGLPPLIWGGEPSCPHQWMEQLTPAANGIVNTAMTGPTLSEASATRRPRRSATCASCGAWRGQLGLEPAPDLYVEHLVEVFREVWRVLRSDGTVWLNLGDSYVGSGRGPTGNNGIGDQARRQGFVGAPRQPSRTQGGHVPSSWTSRSSSVRSPRVSHLKAKDLVGIPWMVAFRLRAEGWYLRSEIIWSKPNPMPESVRDRPTTSHERLFLLAKRERYFYDAEAIREPSISGPSDVRKMIESLPRIGGKHKHLADPLARASAATNLGRLRAVGHPSGRNRRSVWTIATEPFPGAHFATFPLKLVEPCVLSGTSAWGCCPRCGAPWRRDVAIEYRKNRPSAGDDPRAHNADRLAAARGHGGWRGNNLLREVRTTSWEPSCRCDPSDTIPSVVLDPFCGSAATGVAALKHGRRFIGIDLKPAYVRMARQRIGQALDKGNSSSVEESTSSEAGEQKSLRGPTPADPLQLGSVRLYTGDCVRLMHDIADSSFDAVVTDPPYGYEFMGQGWDTLARPRASASLGGSGPDREDGRGAAPTFERARRQLGRMGAWHCRWAAEAFRLLKPGAYLVAFGGCRTHHHLATALEKVGFIIRDELQWQYAQGLPKSMDVAKAFLRTEGDSSSSTRRWRGWGTGLKPAHEPILLCQKPLQGTYCSNVARWGCGALNVDACRIPFESEADRRQAHIKNDHERFESGPPGNHVYQPYLAPRFSYRAMARFPSNVVRSDPLGDGYDRYFVIPKASRTERNRGLGQLPEELGQQRYGSLTGGDYAFVGPDGRGRTRRGARPQRNVHPTVKPIALMEHLLKLVVPPGGRVLDPFAGSGPTLIAAAALGLDVVGIEREARYVEIAIRRLRAIGVRATQGGANRI